ncbi:M23 family metallopeptidase [soil metagenome]
MQPRLLIAGLVISLCGLASAETKVTLSSTIAKPGDAVLVTVTGSKAAPKGTANGKPIAFFPSKGGFQGLFAIPLDAKPEPISFEIESAKKPLTVKVKDTVWPEASVIVEDEMANPPKADRDRIDADNKAIIDATLKDKGELQFTKPFRRPPGAVTSVFGEWRTFNDGHRSQHLGVDFGAKEGAKVNAINAGTVTLVRETFLAGNIVVVSHGAGIASAYYHLSKVSVAEGDVVALGTELGLAGHTGRATGPHLHLSVRVPGGFVDPAAFIKLKLAPPPVVTAKK